MSTTAASPEDVRFIAIPDDLAARVRATLRDDCGHVRVPRDVAAPCRVCLRVPSEPEPMLLLSYSPLADTGPYAETGPVFIHVRDCSRYSEESSFPADFAARPLVVRAYSHEGEIADALVAGPGEGEGAVRRFLQNRAIAEVHIRHTSYTCYDFKAVRAAG